MKFSVIHSIPPFFSSCLTDLQGEKNQRIQSLVVIAKAMYWLQYLLLISSHQSKQWPRSLPLNFGVQLIVIVSDDDDDILDCFRSWCNFIVFIDDDDDDNLLLLIMIIMMVRCYTLWRPHFLLLQVMMFIFWCYWQSYHMLIWVILFSSYCW